MTAKEFSSHIIPIKEFTASKQLKLFESLKKAKVGGQIIISIPQGDQWNFYLHKGNIIYATGGKHPVRRWQRNVILYLPKIASSFSQLQQQLDKITVEEISSCWEYQLLCLWAQQQKISRKQIYNLIRAVTIEILFDLTQAVEVSCQLKADNFLSPQLDLIDASDVITKTNQLWQSWQLAQIADRSPNLAPIVKQAQQLQHYTSDNTYQVLAKLLNGQKTFRDIAVYMKRDTLEVTRSLLPYVELGLVGLVEVEDLPIPIRSVSSSEKPRPLIACVDDSPTVSYMMKQVLTTANYRFLSITNSTRAISVLIEQKPDLIFLDILMPDINGYELCRKLRQVSAFKQTPIIFLTSSDGIIDRLRAKIVGSSGFVSKTVDAWQLLNIIKSYLST